MPYNSSIITNPATLEARKFVEITNDARFPTLSVVRTSYDQSYPPNTSTLGTAVTSLDTYSNYAVSVYLANASDINQNITLSATTLSINNVGIAGVAAVSGTVTVSSVTNPVAVSPANTNVFTVSGGTYLTRTAPVSGSVTITNALTSIPVFGPNASPFGDNASTDSFGRLRISLPNTLLDAKFLYDKQPQYWDEVVNIGASTFVQSDASITMATSGDTGYVIRQTTTRYNYQPGKSMLAVYTFVAPPEVNIVKRIGSFQGLSAAPYTPIDGTYLEIGSNGPSFNIVKTAGTTYSVSVPQSAWNIDPLNGSGPSGLTMDFTKGQIYAMDYEWLGLGRLRFGFYLQGKLYYAHQVTNLNTLSAPYISSPNQPVRYEIRQSGAGAGLMKSICSTVLDESSQEILGTAISVGLSSAVTVQNNLMTPILAVRLNPNNSNLALLGKSFDLYNIDNTANILYKVYRNPSFNAPLTWQNVENSYMQFAVGNPSITLSGGYTLYSGYVPKSQGTGAGTGGVEITSLFGRFGTQINGTPDVIVLAGMGLGATAPVYAAFNAIQKA